MPFSWWNDTVIIVSPGEKTQRGSTVPDWDSATRTTMGNCLVCNPRTDEFRNGRTETHVDAMLLMPYGTDVNAGDRIEHGGTTYVVQGEPMPRTSPTGRVDHVRVDLAVWRG